MSKLLRVFTIAWLCLGIVNAKVTKTENEQNINWDIVVDDVNIQSTNVDDQTFQRAELKGVEGMEGVLYKEGEPSIPVVRIYAFADKAEDISIMNIKNKSLNKTFEVENYLPVVASTEKSLGRKSKIFFAKGFLSSNYPLHKNAFDIQEVGSVRGVLKFLVTLYPLSFDGVNNTVTLVNNHFTVSIKKPNIRPAQTLVWSRQNRGAATDLFLVGTKFADSLSLQKYLAVKQQLQGNKPTVAFVKPEDTEEQVRNVIKNVYVNSKGQLKNVTIIGDSDDITAYKTTSTGTKTDHYYASIDTENYINDIDTPDLAVGRISVNTEEQLAVVLEKNTRYLEKAKRNLESFTWSKNLAFIATDDKYEVAEGTHNYVIDNYSGNLGYLGNFPLANNAGGDKLYAITNKATDAQVVEYMNQGRSIINYSGHGSNDGWYGPTISQDDVRGLTSNALPFVISNACLTGNYMKGESFSETWQRHPNGAIVFWGSTTYTYWDEDDILEKRMFDNIFKDKERNFGRMTNYALAEVWKFYGGAGKSQYYWEAYHVFGDPSLDLVIE